MKHIIIKNILFKGNKAQFDAIIEEYLGLRIKGSKASDEAKICAFKVDFVDDIDFKDIKHLYRHHQFQQCTLFVEEVNAAYYRNIKSRWMVI